MGVGAAVKDIRGNLQIKCNLKGVSHVYIYTYKYISVCIHIRHTHTNRPICIYASIYIYMCVCVSVCSCLMRQALCHPLKGSDPVRVEVFLQVLRRAGAFLQTCWLPPSRLLGPGQGMDIGFHVQLPEVVSNAGTRCCRRQSTDLTAS